MYMMDFFAGSEEKVKAAIGTKVKYPAYVFIRTEDGTDTGKLAFVDQNNVLKMIKGENKQQVVKVDALPETGDAETLYIVDGIVYVYTEDGFTPMYKDHTAELEALSERIAAVETTAEELKVKEEELTAKIEETKENIEALKEASEHLYEKVKYEISSTPVGTLVDYREKEIRVMCPENTVFTKQNVGANGNANMYYMAFKAYAPDDAVGFKEGDQGVIEDEMFDFTGDFAGTDKYGRNYSIVWLALASYDETSDTWSYFGKNSSVEKYIGWTYVVEWYNADGIVIASDKIRINLSNEDCHNTIEPHYIGKMNTEIQTIREAGENTVEEIEKLKETVTTLEQEVFNFVELE